ncbi:hypothetical protein ACGFY6_22805 [Streptomyces sp. NPDC048387]|uniref:hypothetical protein n=1 Tax=Streptomyces sp. NPDC048387 TaxID=3365542 RepID=UPI00371FB057
MDVELVITELYGLRPDQFVAARDAYVAGARQEKDAAAARRIAALRKPTLALWAVGLFARARPAEAQALLQLGSRLRTAHRELDGAQLRTLSHEQHRVIGALAHDTAHMAREAGERISDSVLRAIEEIYRALLADEDVGRLWLEGRLTNTPKAPVGFEGVAPAPGAVPSSPPAAPQTKPAPSGPPPAPARDAAAERRAREHERRLQAARQAVSETRAAYEQAQAELAEAAAVLERAQDEAAAARDELHAVQLRVDAAQKAADAARSRHDRAATASQKAGHAATSATRRLREAESRAE